MPKLPNLAIEASFSGIVVGVDEAGCGPWAGPVVAAAVILNHYRRFPGIDDSKKLSASQREKLYPLIVANAHVGIALSTVCEIDTLNILEARKLAMLRAVTMLGLIPDMVLIDGNRAPILPYPVQMVVGGDARSLSIASASIIAKVTRDRIMAQLASEYPGYGWERNAGYGTGEHQKALVNLGVTPHHRRSYAPVRALLEATDLFGYAA